MNAALSSTVVTASRVERFTIRLKDWPSVLRAEGPARAIETRLLAELENPVRLLRWAVVKVELNDPETPFWCEGAYLKQDVTQSAQDGSPV